MLAEGVGLGTFNGGTQTEREGNRQFTQGNASRESFDEVENVKVGLAHRGVPD